MYPFLRALTAFVKPVKPLKSMWDTAELDMRVWPGDIDIFMELNNGRYLTLMDIGRFNFIRRSGLANGFRYKHWSGAVAGASIRYRKRLHLFQKFTQCTKLVGIDDRWWYFCHSLERHGVIHSNALVRFVITDENGLVPTQKVADELGIKILKQVPDWVKAWDDSDQMRLWEPLKNSDS